MRSTVKTRVLFLTTMALFGGIFIIVFLALTGNTNQVYNDIIIEYTSKLSSNKSIEKKLLYILCIGGIIAYSACYFFTAKKIRIKPVISPKQNSAEFICLVACIAAVVLMVYGYTNPIVIAAMIVATFFYTVDDSLVLTGICCYFLTVYTVIALYRAYVFAGGLKCINNMEVALLSLGVIIAIAFFNTRKKIYLHLGMINSAIIPFALLLHLANRYKQGENYEYIDVSKTMQVAIWMLIIIFSAVAIWYAVKKWTDIDSIEDVIRMGSCITIISVNSFNGTGAIMSQDLHHPFENVIGYSQIFHIGRVPFKDFIPISGMYSVIHGAIFDWFGDGGTFANYYSTNNLFYLFVIVISVYLLKKHVSSIGAFEISLLIYILDYDRYVFVLPVMLLLMMPKLIKKINAWLVTWFLTSLFLGLYYPLCGVAVCVAFLPLGIWEIFRFIKSGELKQHIKNIKFWLAWGACAGLTVICVKYLVGTLRHMKAMSGQSILADGISRFGQKIPDWFFTYLDNLPIFIRVSIYYIITFLIPALYIWVAYAVCLKCGNVRIDRNKIKIENKSEFLITLSAIIMPLIAFSFTIIRLDFDALFARSTSILYVGIILLLTFSWRFIDHGILRIIIVLFAASIPSLVNNAGILATGTSLNAYYQVPENYTFVNETPIEKIGKGFIDKDVYESLLTMQSRFSESNPEQSYFGDPGVFGYYYLLDIKGDSTMEIGPTVKSYSAAEEAVEFVKRQHSIIGMNFSTSENYYLYHWLQASGEYYWNAQMRQFIPNDGKYSIEEIRNQNKENQFIYDNPDMGRTSGSWGLSMTSLEKIFVPRKYRYNLSTTGKYTNVNFEDSFDGDDADFLYLDFANMNTNYQSGLFNADGEVIQQEQSVSKYLMKKDYNSGVIVEIRWQSEDGNNYSMRAQMSQGKLLFPLGAGIKWLFNKHHSISVHVFDNGEEINVPEISNIRFLKLREVQ